MLELFIGKYTWVFLTDIFDDFKKKKEVKAKFDEITPYLTHKSIKMLDKNEPKKAVNDNEQE